MAEEAEATVEDLEPSTDAAAEVAAEDEGEVILEGLELGAKKPAEEATTEEAEKPAEKPESDTDKRLADLEKNYKLASDHITDLKKALHQTRQENKKLKDGGGKKAEDEFLTDEQVKAILEEHGNDWSTVLRVVNHQAQKAAAKAKNEFTNDFEVKQVQERTKSFLEQEWPEALKEDSEVRPQIEKAVSDLRLDGHPLADFLAASAFFFTNWKNVSEKIREEARKEALGEKAETVRKEVVKKTGLTAKTTGDKKPAAGPALPANLDERAKQMGLTARQKQIYAKLVKGGGNLAAQAGA